MGGIRTLAILTGRIVLGALAFIVALYAAVGVGLAARFAEVHFGAPPWLVASAGWVEVIIWVGDLLVVGLFIVRDLVLAVRDFVEEVRPNAG